jgi:hypothetical protein
VCSPRYPDKTNYESIVLYGRSLHGGNHHGRAVWNGAAFHRSSPGRRVRDFCPIQSGRSQRVASIWFKLTYHQLTYAGDLLWVTVIALIQLSVLAYYVHNFGQRTITLPAYVIMSLCSALWVAGSFATAFLCTPPKRIWLADTPGHCGDRKMLHTGVNASETILSFFIVILPIPLIWDIPLSKTRKTSLACIQVLGLG